MQNKESQSMLDFINIIPDNLLSRYRKPFISNKEATTLYNIWKSNKDEYGKFIIPKETSKVIVNKLNNIGLIRTSLRSDVAEITKKGQEIIKNIILHTEKSSFEKQADGEINYELIHQAILNGPKVKEAKIASKIKHNHNMNWLKKCN